MNHLLCARCDAVLEHVDALLGRWRLEECNGSPVLMGTCGYCGATREFRASYNEEPVPMRGRKL